MINTNRGISIYKQLLIIDEEVATDAAPATQQIGRSPELIAARDNFLLHRFYFKTRLQRKVYPDALAELSTETWLSKVMITKIIQAKADNILMIKKQQPSAKILAEVWPHIKW